jgi:hypothetical protein
MITDFVEKYMSGKDALRSVFAEKHPENYKAIIEAVVKQAAGDADYDVPDPERIHQIDDGDYQGTLVFVIGGKGYQPSDYWYVKVSYGSCSSCDTLEAIKNYSDEKPTEEEIDQYMTLALHVVQGMKKMGEESA